MSVEKMRKNHTHEIGTSFGLAAAEFNGAGCEQLSVFATDDEQRPVNIEFWEGYSIPNQAVLTRSQAIELARLLFTWAVGEGVKTNKS